MARKQERYRPFQLFECPYEKDRHIRKTHFMLNHPNYISLSANAKVLYEYLLDWAAGKSEVTFAASLADSMMSRPTFIKARNELIKAGFIKYVNWHRNKRDGECKCEAGEYEFLGDWINKPNAEKSVREYVSTYKRRM